MKNTHHILQTIIIALTLMMAFGLKAEAQNENKFIRRGNNAYADQDFIKAEIDYRNALEKNQNSAKGSSIWELRCISRKATRNRSRFMKNLPARFKPLKPEPEPIII